MNKTSKRLTPLPILMQNHSGDDSVPALNIAPLTPTRDLGHHQYHSGDDSVPALNIAPLTPTRDLGHHQYISRDNSASSKSSKRKDHPSLKITSAWFQGVILKEVFYHRTNSETKDMAHWPPVCDVDFFLGFLHGLSHCLKIWLGIHKPATNAHTHTHTTSW